MRSWLAPEVGSAVFTHAATLGYHGLRRQRPHLDHEGVSVPTGMLLRVKVQS